MARNRKAEVMTFGSKQDITHREIRMFSKHNYTPRPRPIQCQRCLSDYMRHSIDGICQSCLQAAEFRLRECSAAAAIHRARRAL